MGENESEERREEEEEERDCRGLDLDWVVVCLEECWEVVVDGDEVEKVTEAWDGLILPFHGLLLFSMARTVGSGLSSLSHTHTYPLLLPRFSGLRSFSLIIVCLIFPKFVNVICKITHVAHLLPRPDINFCFPAFPPYHHSFLLPFSF